jgi:hypothetical protein
MTHNPLTAPKRPVTEALGPHKALYVDGFNFLRQWLGLDKRANLDAISFPYLYTQCLDCIEANIKDFMSHARRSGWVVSVFFDNFKKVNYQIVNETSSVLDVEPLQKPILL